MGMVVEAGHAENDDLQGTCHAARLQEFQAEATMTADVGARFGEITPQHARDLHIGADAQIGRKTTEPKMKGHIGHGTEFVPIGLERGGDLIIVVAEAIGEVVPDAEEFYRSPSCL